jgi:hypothetical protein
MSGNNEVEMSVMATSPHPKTEQNATKAKSEAKDPEVPPNDESSQPKQKKSLAFKLSFIGLAAILFVFQIDATALGIALPVSSPPPSDHHPY